MNASDIKFTGGLWYLRYTCVGTLVVLFYPECTFIGTSLLTAILYALLWHVLKKGYLMWNLYWGQGRM